MPKFKVTMEEIQSDGSVLVLEQTAVCETRSQVITFYGLEQPDIASYSIEEIPQ